MQERCIGADGGWRKLIMFNSTDMNNGTRDLHIGDIPYVTSDGRAPAIIAHGDTSSTSATGTITSSITGRSAISTSREMPRAGDQQKRGFCLIDLIRLANAEWSPLTIKYSIASTRESPRVGPTRTNLGIPCHGRT
jgi:hypothetical protein